MKLALIGCGTWGYNYLKTINTIDCCELKWVCDLDYEKLNQAAEIYPQMKFTNNKEDILGDNEIQGVIIATRPESHYILAKEAINKGKAVLVEKPVTISRKDNNSLINFAAVNNTVLMAGHTLLYHPAIKKLKMLMEEKHIIDDLCYFSMYRTSSTSEAPRVDVLYDLAVHDIYLSRYLMDMDPTWVVAHRERYIESPYNNAINILLGFPNGKTVSIYASFVQKSKTRKISLVTPKIKLLFDDTQTMDKKIKVLHTGEHEHYLALENKSLPLTEECIHFIECIRDHKEPVSGKKNIEFVAKTINCISESLAKGGERVNIH